MTPKLTRPSRITVTTAAAVAVVLGISACSSSGSSAAKGTGGAKSGSGGSKAVSLVAYSVPKPAYTALEAAFGRTAAGKGVSFQESYGPSGTQSKQVLAGQKADYVAFSTGSDMNALVPSKVATGWDGGATKGIVADSVVVIVVRKGNPLHITGWDDLAKPGVKIVTPDPASSGSAKWNLLAAYQHVLSEGGDATAAAAYVKKFFSHVVSRAESGSVAATQFTSGTGNVLISYESEAIANRAKGAAIEYVIPKQSMLIETPAAVTKSAPSAAKNFLSFAESSQGQQIFASTGFRPAVAGTKIGTVKGATNPTAPYPSVPQLTTISQLGGWKAVNAKFFGDSGLIVKIEKTG